MEDFLKERGVDENSIRRMLDDGNCGRLILCYCFCEYFNKLSRRIGTGCETVGRSVLKHYCKVDTTVISVMELEQLGKYLPRYGDRLALFAFAKQQTAVSRSPKSSSKSVREKLIEKLQRKRTNEEHVRRAVPQSGNKNAKKGSRKIEVGWAHVYGTGLLESVKQVRRPNGGGTIDLQVALNATMSDILEAAMGLFFPGGISKKGPREDFEFHIRDQKHDVLDMTKTLEEIFDETKIKNLRLYMVTTAKTENSLETKETSSDSESTQHENVLPPTDTADNILLPNEIDDCFSMTGLTERANALYSNAEITAFELSETRDVLDEVSRAVSQFQQGVNQLNTEQRSDPSSFPTILSNMSPARQVPREPNNGNQSQQGSQELKTNNIEQIQAEETNGPYKVQHAEYKVDQEHGSTNEVRQTQQGESKNYPPQVRPQNETTERNQLQEGVDALNQTQQVPNEMNQAQGLDRDSGLSNEENQDALGSRATISLHRTILQEEMLQHFKSEEITNLSINFKFIDELGHDADGVSRDAYSAFWESFFLKNSDGEIFRVPVLSKDYGQEEWEAVGRILMKGYKDHRYFPIMLAPAFSVAVIHGEAAVTPQLLKESFLSYISTSEKDVIEASLSNNPVEEDELLAILDRFECRNVPNAKEMPSTVIQVAHKVLIQEPKYSLDAMRGIGIGIWDKLFPDIDSVLYMYDKVKPTENKVIQLLEATVTTKEQDTCLGYLRRFIRGRNEQQLRTLLRFLTGADVICVPKIQIEFITRHGKGRQPSVHTCGPLLELPSTYVNYPDFRSEWENILQNQQQCMEMNIA